ncbi:MAG: endonuclease/exonuclease/phosphatase family protein [Alistipes sp.]|nr:endonuclease/exonuclease/phosphatase family protein [Alistipes sp.]
MKKFILLLAAIVSVVVVDAKPKQKELNLRVGTYNVWAHYARQGLVKKGKALEARSWDNSKEAVAELIVKLDCDLLGMQEVSGVCRDDLAKLVKKAGGKQYKLWWLNTYPEGHRREVGNAIFYNKKNLKLENQAIYYLSPTPEVMSKGWDEKRYYRAALATVVTHKKSGKKFYFIATHGPLAKGAKGPAGDVLVEIDKKYNREGLPTIVLGDMNSRPGDPFHLNMTKYYEDAFIVAEKKCGTVGTFNSAAGSDKNFKLSHRRIDHIYVHSTDKGAIKVKSYEVNRDKVEINGVKVYPSDHNPVIADITIK